MQAEPAIVKGHVIKYKLEDHMARVKMLVEDHPNFPFNVYSDALIWNTGRLKSGEDPIFLYNKEKTLYAHLSHHRGYKYRSKACVGRVVNPRLFGNREAHAKTLIDSPVCIEVDFSSMARSIAKDERNERK